MKTIRMASLLMLAATTLVGTPRRPVVAKPVPFKTRAVDAAKTVGPCAAAFTAGVVVSLTVPYVVRGARSGAKAVRQKWNARKTPASVVTVNPGTDAVDRAEDS